MACVEQHEARALCDEALTGNQYREWRPRLIWTYLQHGHTPKLWATTNFVFIILHILIQNLGLTTIDSDLLVSPTVDLRDQMNKKSEAHQITLHGALRMPIWLTCEQAVGVWPVLCNPSIQSTKRCRRRRKDVFSEEEYPKVTANMAEHGQGKQLPIEYDNSNIESASIYYHICT